MSLSRSKYRHGSFWARYLQATDTRCFKSTPEAASNNSGGTVLIGRWPHIEGHDPNQIVISPPHIPA